MVSAKLILNKKNTVAENLNGDEDYKESFKCYIDNFEIIIKNKKSRKSNKTTIIK